MKEKLEKLDAEEHAQVFAIIKRYTNEYTLTQTGVLVSSEMLPDECLTEIETMAAYYIDQRKRMDADVAERKTMANVTRK